MAKHGLTKVFCSLKVVMMNKERPPIPAPIKRQVRQDCGYGCVICGKILYDIDHIEDYAKVKNHDPKNLVLLCKEHHSEKTNKLLSKDIVKRAKESPHNLKKRSTFPYLYRFNDDKIRLKLGSVLYDYRFFGFNLFTIPLLIDNVPFILVRKENNNLLISLCIHDENGEVILKIIDNELVVYVDAWDFEFVGSEVTLRNGPRNIALIFKYHLNPLGIEVKRLSTRHGAWNINIGSDQNVNVSKEGSSRVFGNSYLRNICVGIAIGDKDVFKNIGIGIEC